MPALDKREDEEAALALLLMKIFDDARRQAAAGQVDWNKFEADVRQTLEDQLAAVFLLAAMAMAGGQGHAGLFSGAAWSAGYSKGVAGEIAQSSAAKIAGGADPAVVFGETRASTIAVTEVTTATTRGEAEVAGDIETKSGDKLEPFWRTARDAAVCSVCAPLDKMPRDVWGEDYPFGPPAHPNCRCHLDYKRLAQGLREV